MNDNQKLLKAMYEVSTNVQLTKAQHLELEQIYKHLNEQLDDPSNTDNEPSVVGDSDGDHVVNNDDHGVD